MRLTLAIILALSHPAMAQAPVLSMELNAAEDAAGACRLTFLAENHLGADLTALGIEAVVFTPDGKVERLMLLDFQTLPQARPRVRQFDLPGIACAGVGRILVNAVTPCTGAGIDPGLCAAALQLRARLDGIEVAG
jgi:hypothetical protein